MISGIKVAVKLSVISQAKRPKLITLTETLIIPAITKTESNNCFITHWFEENREFTQRWWRRQRERLKSDRFRQTLQKLCTCITLFCTFLFCRYTTTTWNCLISRLVEDTTKRKQLSFSFPGLWCSHLEFNSKKIGQHLTNYKTRWNKRDNKVWGNANSLFKWRFRQTHRRAEHVFGRSWKSCIARALCRLVGYLLADN